MDIRDHTVVFLATMATLGWLLFGMCIFDHNFCHILRAAIPFIEPE
jgi:uncharacterized membrane protein